MKTGFSGIMAFCVFAAMMAVHAPAVNAQVDIDTSKGKSILLNNANPMGGLKSISLLDPERFSMKNQYMMSFSSTSGNGSLMGMYINTMEYRFNCPLIMRLSVAYQSQTGHLFGDKNAFTGNPNYQDGRMFIPSFDMEYHPTKKTTISFHYRDFSTMNPFLDYGFGGYGFSNRYRRYGHSPFMMW
jgi:hypothetical protein